MNEITLDEIYGVNIDDYCLYHAIIVNDLIGKVKKDIELLRKRLHILTHEEDKVLDQVTHEVVTLMNKKEKHLKRLIDWKRSAKMENKDCYRVLVTVNGEQKDLGCFENELQAALTRLLAIKKYGLDEEPYPILNEYQVRIIEWEAERQLFNYSKETEKRLLDEEMSEFQTAYVSGDEYESVDALCDQYVVLTQTFAKAGLAGVKIGDNEWLRDAFNIYGVIPDTVEELGFNFECAMDETIKEISSRVGSIGADGKWYKDTSPEAMAKRYKADYEKCRKES